MTQTATLNGVDTEALAQKAGALQHDPGLAEFNFRIRNHWINGGHNQSLCTDFHGVGEDIAHEHPFTLEADEPPVLLSTDKGANPVEHLLHALAGCLTSSLVYHAAARGIVLDEVESTVEGDIDVRGFMGLSDRVRKGYQNIHVSFKVKTDASPQQLRELANYSPVFDTLQHGTNVWLSIETK